MTFVQEPPPVLQSVNYSSGNISYDGTTVNTGTSTPGTVNQSAYEAALTAAGVDQESKERWGI